MLAASMTPDPARQCDEARIFKCDLVTLAAACTSNSSFFAITSPRTRRA
jgi:hypothetical protein